MSFHYLIAPVHVFLHFIIYLHSSLFEEAVEAAGLEFRSDKLWDAYIDWEKANGNMTNVLKIYDRLLSSQTQQYIKHFTK